jgi:hypothetical protein
MGEESMTQHFGAMGWWHAHRDGDGAAFLPGGAANYLDK